MKVYLVRHGESESNKGIHTGKETVLTDIGVEQAKRMGIYFHNKKIDIIYCSQLIRAKDTLKEIKPYLGKVKIKYTKLINEWSRGIYQNVEREKLIEAAKKSGIEFHHYRPPDGENIADVKKRVEKFYFSLKRNHSNDNVLAVGHGLFFRILIMHIMDIHVGEIKYFDLNNAGISYFDIDDSYKVNDFEVDDVKNLIKYSSYERKKWR